MGKTQGVNILYENFHDFKRELKIFTRLHEKRRYNAADIGFINLCFKSTVTPHFLGKLLNLTKIFFYLYFPPLSQLVYLHKLGQRWKIKVN